MGFLRASRREEVKMALKFREVEVFWAVYKSQSVSEAAKLLSVSQPAISMMLKSAESRFGVPLFERSGGRLRPTPEARALFPAASRIFSEMKELENEVMRVRNHQSRALRVAATSTLVAAYLHPSLPDFRRQHPETHITILTVGTEQAVDLAAKGVIDIGISYGVADHPDATGHDLCTAEIMCVLRRDHPLAKKQIITPADLQGENPLTYRFETAFGREIDRIFQAEGATADFHLQSTALTAACLAEQGFGVALIDPVVLNGNLFHNLVVRPFRPLISITVQIVTPRNAVLSKVGESLIEMIRSVAKSH
jgi:DNA-binding transcriptional LysR family regulator